jgi:uncharacterized protein (TIGR03118 family)
MRDVMKLNLLNRLCATGVLVLALGTSAMSAKPANTNNVPGPNKTNAVTGYVQVNLVSNTTNAPHTDARLVNAWGLVAGPGLLWVNNAESGLTTTYRPSGGTFKGAIRIPSPDGTNNGAPTGLVQNNSFFSFVITNGNRRGTSQFLMATEDGTIAAWSRFVSKSDATIVVDRSASNSVYKGIALARLTNGVPQLYATDFHNGMVDVFDRNFQYVMSFTDTNVPAGFAPFNVRNIDGNLFVTFAKQKPPENEDDDPLLGNGFVDEFAPDGTLIRRVISQGALNSPWGLAVAPKNFGQFSRALLVGNFGDGKINAYDIDTGDLLGNLKDKDGNDIEIEGLWGLEFADGKRLYFTAGPNDEEDGLFGFIRRASPRDNQNTNQNAQ